MLGAEVFFDPRVGCLHALTANRVFFRALESDPAGPPEGGGSRARAPAGGGSRARAPTGGGSRAHAPEGGGSESRRARRRRLESARAPTRARSRVRAPEGSRARAPKGGGQTSDWVSWILFYGGVWKVCRKVLEVGAEVQGGWSGGWSWVGWQAWRVTPVGAGGKVCGRVLEDGGVCRRTHLQVELGGVLGR